MTSPITSPITMVTNEGMGVWSTVEGMGVWSTVEGVMMVAGGRR